MSEWVSEQEKNHQSTTIKNSALCGLHHLYVATRGGREESERELVRQRQRQTEREKHKEWCVCVCVCV